MKTFTLTRNERAVTGPNPEILKAIEEAEKKPDECTREFNLNICTMKHKKAVRLYKDAIASGAKRPRIQDPCLYCKLISDKLLEEAQKAKGENAIEYEDEEEAEKDSTKVVTQKVTKEIDHESNTLVQVNKKQIKEDKPKVVEPETKKCAYCGKDFTPVSPKNLYCSIKCRDKKNNEKRVEKYRKNSQTKKEEKKCENCGKTFSTSIKYQRFCCQSCSRDYHNKRRSEAVKKYNDVKAVPEVKSEVVENSQPKEAPVKSYKININPVQLQLELAILADYLQRFGTVIDFLLEAQKGEGFIGTIFRYLSDDIYAAKQRLKNYLDRLEGKPS